MSLTLLVDRELRSVGVVRWFLDPKVSISYATGPLTQMSFDELRSVGWDWIRRHFQEYAEVRVSEDEATAVFEPGQERKFLKERRAVRIRVEDSGDLTLIPQTFGNYTLAGLQSLGMETRRTIPANASPDVFWRTFDEVLAIASEA